MENNTKEIIIKVEGQKWKEAQEKAYKKISQKVKVDGFRPGKAPKDVIIKKYGQMNLYIDAGDLCISDAYKQMIEENENLQIVTQPDMVLNHVDENAIEFKFILTLKPTVTLGKYTNLGIKKEEVEVTQEEIEETIHQMQHRYAEKVEKEGTVEEGDEVIIDFEGLKDGIPFDGGKAENYALTIGSNTFIPGFEEQLIGMKKEEEKEIHVTFPEDYHAEELKGQPVVFKIKLHEIKQTVIPEIGKEFFEDLGMEGIDSLEALQKQVKENIYAHKEMDAENKYMDELLETAAKEVKVDIPEVMIKEEQDRMIKQYEENLKMQGLSLEQFYQFTAFNEEALRDQVKEESTKRVTYRLMLEEISKQEKIEISDEEADKEAEEMAAKYQIKKEELIESIGGIEMIKYDLSMRKAMEILKK